jgi:hypothetical protein
MNVIAFPNAAAAACQQQRTESVVLFIRKGTDVNGYKFEETILQTPDETFWLKVRSEDPGHCFDHALDGLVEVFEYIDEASGGTPFDPAVIDGGR